jgi:hypothetical protein
LGRATLDHVLTRARCVEREQKAVTSREIEWGSIRATTYWRYGPQGMTVWEQARASAQVMSPRDGLPVT